MKRIKTPQSQGRDYKQMLKDYFGKFLYGLQVEQDGGRVLVQIVYYDFKHISTVRRELAQMMPEVEFTKLKRDFTEDAELWALRQLYNGEREDSKNTPIIYVQRGDALVKSSLRNIARSELSQLEIEDDEITYPDNSLLHCFRKFSDNQLEENSWD